MAKKKRLTDRIVTITFALKDGRGVTCSEVRGAKAPGDLRRDTYRIDVHVQNLTDDVPFVPLKPSERRLIETMFRKARQAFDSDVLYRRRSKGLPT